eukprot:6486922-Amphidinium_carterae.2
MAQEYQQSMHGAWLPKRKAMLSTDLWPTFDRPKGRTKCAKEGSTNHSKDLVIMADNDGAPFTIPSNTI